MATEPIIKVWCDVCLGKEDQRVEAKLTRVITIGGQQRKQLDLCDDHTEMLIIVEDVLNLYGTVPTDALPKPGRQRRHGSFICPRCARVIPTRGAASSHARSHHGVPLSVLEFESGLGPEPPELIKCTDCDAGMFESLQGYAAHRLRIHGEAPSKVKMPATTNGGRQPHRGAVV